MSNKQIVQLVIALGLLFGGTWVGGEFLRLRHEADRLSERASEKVGT